VRVILVGTPSARSRLRALLPSSLDVVAEARTVAAAWELDVEADAIVSAARETENTFEESTVEPLTPRELDVLTLMAEGLPNKQIGEKLGISDQTVKFHVTAICGKLAAANRTDAVRRAIRRGLIPI
jgi:DNA-binding NarL/FixJ family response regulator